MNLIWPFCLTLLLVTLANGQRGCNCINAYNFNCGVDGITYDNDCLRECRGVAKRCDGRCPCGSQSLRPPNTFYNPFPTTRAPVNQRPACVCCSSSPNKPQFCSLVYVDCSACPQYYYGGGRRRSRRNPTNNCHFCCRNPRQDIEFCSRARVDCSGC